jgi:hypothetical protein
MQVRHQRLSIRKGKLFIQLYTVRRYWDAKYRHGFHLEPLCRGRC